MALHLFVFLLVVCLLLALALLWCLDRLPDRAFPPTRRGQAQLTPPSAETPHPRRLPGLSSRIPSRVGWRDSVCAGASLV
jgi:hypothetical protein